MRASQTIEKLQTMIDEHGDQETVSGLDRTGYGEPVEDVELVTANLQDIDGKPVTVFDLILSDSSSCAIGGF